MENMNSDGKHQDPKRQAELDALQDELVKHLEGYLTSGKLGGFVFLGYSPEDGEGDQRGISGFTIIKVKFGDIIKTGLPERLEATATDLKKQVILHYMQHLGGHGCADPAHDAPKPETKPKAAPKRAALSKELKDLRIKGLRVFDEMNGELNGGTSPA